MPEFLEKDHSVLIYSEWSRFYSRETVERVRLSRLTEISLASLPIGGEAPTLMLQVLNVGY